MPYGSSSPLERLKDYIEQYLSLFKFERNIDLKIFLDKLIKGANFATDKTGN